MDSRLCYAGHATGAVRHTPNPKDFQMHRLPGVAARLAIELPPSRDHRSDVVQIYQQGPIPCCQTVAVALMKAVMDRCAGLRWAMYEFLEAYHACGGDDREGIEPRAVLQYAQETGLRVSGGTVRHRIGSYAFAPRDTPELFTQTLKAAICAGRPCIVQLRLPETFGWDSAGPATEAYHELCLVGYQPGGWIAANSWGDAWGHGGFGRLPIDYLTANNFQNGDCAAYTAIDCLDDSLAPPGP